MYSHTVCLWEPVTKCHSYPAYLYQFVRKQTKHWQISAAPQVCYGSIFYQFAAVKILETSREMWEMLFQRHYFEKSSWGSCSSQVQLGTNTIGARYLPLSQVPYFFPSYSSTILYMYMSRWDPKNGHWPIITWNTYGCGFIASIKFRLGIFLHFISSSTTSQYILHWNKRYLPAGQVSREVSLAAISLHLSPQAC